MRTRRWGLTMCNTKCKAWYSSVATLYRWRARARIGKTPRKETRQKGRHTVCANNGKPEGSPRDCRSATLYRWCARARIGKTPREETRQKGRHTVCANNGKPEGSPRDCRSASARGMARTGGQCEKARAAVRGLIRRDRGCADDRLSVR